MELFAGLLARLLRRLSLPLRRNRIRRMNTVKLRRSFGKDNYPIYALHVPADIGQHLEHLVGASFSVELTDEGILYRLTFKAGEEPAPPNWAQK